MRLFLGIRFDEKMNKTLMSVLHDLKVHGVTGSYVSGKNMHMTLVFIGETDQFKEVKEAIGSVPVPSMRISLDKFGTFGNILVAEAKGNQKLKGYVTAVRTALDQAGIAYDKKKFVPHITLIRKFTGNYKAVTLPKQDMTVARVSLLKSVQKDGKVTYSEVAGWDA